jgi:hypothetical protein
MFAQAGGSWHGNDTLWRTVLDINRSFLYFDRAAGIVGQTPSRAHLAVLDGLIGGERESPLSPSPVAAGLVLAARNPLALDTVAAALMGLDWRKLAQLARAYELLRHPIADFSPDEIAIRGWRGIERVADIYERRAFVRFEPSVGWRGHVEFHSPLPAPRETDSPDLARAGVRIV